MKKDKKPTARKINIVIQQFENVKLIYDLKIDKAFCLNQTSSLVWNECDGTQSVAGISQKLSKNHVSFSVKILLIWQSVNLRKTDYWKTVQNFKLLLMDCRGGK